MENKLSKKIDIFRKASISVINIEGDDAVRYYIEHGIPNKLNVADIFRPGSEAFCKLFRNLRKLVDCGKLSPNEELADYLTTDVGEMGIFEGVKVALDVPYVDEEDRDYREGLSEDRNDAKYQGKDVDLNNPKRGGSKKFYVYVKDGDKVKKVSFGSPDMPLRVSDSEARKSFKARHKCETKNDKATAGYWSCRIGRYPNLTGAKKKYTWW